MSTIPVLQKSTSVPQSSLWSDAAVERAYNRISRGNVAWANAVTGAIDSATKTVFAGAQLANKVITKIEHDEDVLAKATYQKRMSDWFLDRRQKVLSGQDKLSTDQELGDWVKAMHDSTDTVHKAIMMDDDIKPAAQRLGTQLKVALQAQMNAFVLKNFGEKYKENKIRSKNMSLTEFENPDVYSSADAIAAQIEVSRAHGASEDEIAAARTKGAYLNIQSFVDSQVSEWRNSNQETLLNARAPYLESALNYIRAKADSDGDGKIDYREQDLIEKLSADAQRRFTLTETQKSALRKEAIAKEFAKETEDLRVNIGTSNEHAKNMAKQFVSEHIASLRTTDAGQKWVLNFFAGDYDAAEKSIRDYWTEKEKTLSDLFGSDAQKEIDARHEAQCKAYSELLSLMVKADSESQLRMAQLGLGGIKVNILPENSDLRPGQITQIGDKFVQRVSGKELLGMLDACKEAHNGKNPAALAWVIGELRQQGKCYSPDDVQRIGRFLSGGYKYGGTADRFIGALREELTTIPRAYGKGFDSDEKAEIQNDKHAMDAYFKACDKLFDRLDDYDSGYGKKGSSLNDAVAPLIDELKQAINQGKSWDKRFKILQGFAQQIGVAVEAPVKNVSEQ